MGCAIGSRSVSPLTGDRRFESTSLQRGVSCEPCRQVKGHFGHRQLSQVEQTFRSLYAKPMPRQWSPPIRTAKSSSPSSIPSPPFPSQRYDLNGLNVDLS